MMTSCSWTILNGNSGRRAYQTRPQLAHWISQWWESDLQWGIADANVSVKSSYPEYPLRYHRNDAFYCGKQS